MKEEKLIIVKNFDNNGVGEHLHHYFPNTEDGLRRAKSVTDTYRITQKSNEFEVQLWKNGKLHRRCKV